MIAATFEAAHNNDHNYDTTTTTECDEPRSRQAAALNMGPDVEHAVMTMLKGNNPDWQDFKDRLGRSAAAARDATAPTHHTVSMLVHDEGDGELLATAEDRTVVIRAAMDSGSVANVIHPDDLPAGVEIKENTTGKHFSGAGGSLITKYGSCSTVNQTKGGGKFGARWQVADVTRPLNSVSETCGPIDGKGKQDVLFTNKKCFVVPPGVVDEIMRRTTAVVEYDRSGGLYLADIEMSSFTRQGPGR